MSQRYQREIEEILGKANDGEAPPEAPARGRRAPSRAAPPRRPRRFALDFTPGSMFVAGVVLLLAALVVNLLNVTVAGFGAAGPLAWVGIGLFIFAYISYFTRPRRTIERRWRGQSIEDAPGGGGPLGRLWRWITRG